MNHDHKHAFLLCTDGFWEYVTEQEMEDTLIQSEHPEDWIKKMYKILKNKVREEKIVEGMQAEEEEDIEEALWIAVLLLISGYKKGQKT